MKLKKLVTVVVSLLLVCTMLSLPAAATSTKTSSKAQVDFEAGVLTLVSVPSVSFGENKLSARTVVYPAKTSEGVVRVIDARGNVAGWTVKVSLSRFTDNNKSVLPGSSMIITKPTVKSTSPAKPPSYIAPELELVSGDNANQTLWTASKSEGNGGWNMNVNPEHVGLRVPANPDGLPGNSHANLYWTLIDAPAN